MLLLKSLVVASGPEVRFNSLIIGTVDNGESSKEASYTQEMIDNVVKGIVMKRRGEPQVIANAIAFYSVYRKTRTVTVGALDFYLCLHNLKYIILL